MRQRPQTWTRTVMLPAEAAKPWDSLIGTQQSGVKLDSVQEKRQLNLDPFMCHIKRWSNLRIWAHGRFGYAFKRHCRYYKLLLELRQKHARSSPSLLPHFICRKIETACWWKLMCVCLFLFCFVFLQTSEAQVWIRQHECKMCFCSQIRWIGCGITWDDVLLCKYMSLNRCIRLLDRSL